MDDMLRAIRKGLGQKDFGLGRGELLLPDPEKLYDGTS